MGGTAVNEFEEGEDVLDSLTRHQLEQAAEDYDENKQVCFLPVRDARVMAHLE